jgi:hypothetical protein
MADVIDKDNTVLNSTEIKPKWAQQMWRTNGLERMVETSETKELLKK